MNQMLKARKVYLSQASNHQDRKNRPRVIRALNFLLTKKLCNFINTKIKLFWEIQYPQISDKEEWKNTLEKKETMLSEQRQQMG